jgi:enoyl-CoA hydratase/carnithine racemase
MTSAVPGPPGIRLHFDERPGGRVAVVTVDHQRKLNILDSALMRAFVDTFEHLAQDDAVRAVVLRGAGERAFVGGADIREMAQLDPAGAERFITLLHHACAAPRRLKVPVIAVLRGWVLGAGLELAVSCDLRIAARDARFSMPEVRVGIPSVIEAALLPNLIGWGRTRWLLLTGQAIDAQRALDWGLVEEIVPPEQLEAVLDLLLDAILAGGPNAIRLQKALIARWEDATPTEAIRAGIDAFRTAFHTDEPGTMLRHFLEQKT